MQYSRHGIVVRNTQTADIRFVLLTTNYKPDMQIIWSSIMDSVNAVLFDYLIKGQELGGVCFR
jgi:hypothetical protein